MQLAKGYKANVLACTIEREEVQPGQNGYDIDTLEIYSLTYFPPPEPEEGEEPAEGTWGDPQLLGTYDVRPAQESPVSQLDVLLATLASHESDAPRRILSLKVKAAMAMVRYAGYTESEAMAEGTRFIVDHAALISAFNLAGGNGEAGKALYADIALDSRTWLRVKMGDTSEAPLILSLFKADLDP